MIGFGALVLYAVGSARADDAATIFIAGAEVNDLLAQWEVDECTLQLYTRAGTSYDTAQDVAGRLTGTKSQYTSSWAGGWSRIDLRTASMADFEIEAGKCVSDIGPFRYHCWTAKVNLAGSWSRMRFKDDRVFDVGMRLRDALGRLVEACNRQAEPSPPTRSPLPRAAVEPLGPPHPAPKQVSSPSRATLTVSSLPKAQVLVDGEYVRTTPLFEHALATGEHTVELVAEDGRRTEFKVDVQPGDHLRRIWSFDTNEWLASVPTTDSDSPTATNGLVFVTVRPGRADIYVDGRRIGTTPFKGVLPVGPHEIRVVNDTTGHEQTKTVTVKAGETALVVFSGS